MIIISLEVREDVVRLDMKTRREPTLATQKTVILSMMKKNARRSALVVSIIKHSITKTVLHITCTQPNLTLTIKALRNKKVSIAIPQA